jgi:hypothetical protein
MGRIRFMGGVSGKLNRRVFQEFLDGQYADGVWGICFFKECLDFGKGLVGCGDDQLEGGFKAGELIDVFLNLTTVV